MNYTYKLTPSQTIGGQLFEADTVIRVEDGAIVPFDPDNTSYQEYLEWLAEGNTPAAAVDPEEIPAE